MKLYLDDSSDGSGDSFFETTTRKGSKPVKTAIPKDAQSANKSKMESLFNDDDDLISDLGFNPKKPKSGSKSSVLDDLLAPIGKSIAAKKDISDVARTPKISRQSTETTESSVPASQGRPRTSTGRHSSVTSSIDPLGLFASKPKDAPPEPTERKKFGSTASTADWLGLGTGANDESRNRKENELSRPSSPTSHVEPQREKPAPFLPPSSAETIIQRETTPQIVPNNSFLIASNNLEAENALQLLKQQETQVAMVGQIRSYEFSLVEMQKRQQQMLDQQDAQFNELLQKQMKRQSQLETNIRSQQERINAHIQLLMTQPSAMTVESSPRHDGSPSGGAETTGTEDTIQLEADVRRLELEKLRLEDLLSNINARHENEIEFMENAYRKQLKVQEENATAIEARLQNEIKSIEDFYTRKLKLLQDEKSSAIAEYEENIRKLKEEHAEAFRQAKASYEDDMQSLKEEHKRMIETIRQSKLLEFSALQDNASYLETLREASNYLQNAGGELRTIKDEMDTKISLMSREREAKVEARERKVDDAERRLQLSEEIADQERKRLMDLVSTLETQLGTLSKESTEQNWILRQKLSSLAIEKESFEKEKQFARDQITRDEKRIEDLKQYQLDEAQRSMQQIADERHALTIEKSQLETMKKLEAPGIREKSNTEVEIALKVAKDAANQADQEREKYFHMQRDLERLKRELVDKEHMLKSKEDEIATEKCSLRILERKCQEVLQRSRLAEQTVKDKINLLQMRTQQVTEREAQLSQERLQLSKERLNLQDVRNKVEQNKCSLCKIGQSNPEIGNIMNRNAMIMDSVYDNFGMGFHDRPENFPPNIVTANYCTRTPVDRLIDEDIIESLKRMKTANLSMIGGAPDFDENFLNLTSSGNVPTDAELVILSHDINKEFSKDS